MASLLITYDLVGTNDSSENYERLIEAIKAYPNWGRVQLSVWIVKSSQTPAQVRDALLQHSHASDRLFVAELTGAAAWRNARCESSWLQENL